MMTTIPLFDSETAINLTQNRSLLGNKARTLWAALLHIQFGQVEGDLAELGVYWGGTARMIAGMSPERTLHLFDTFSGLPPEDSDIDLHHQGEFSDTTEASVRDLLKDFSNTIFHVGVFPETALNLDARFAFVHLDADLYSSTRDALDWFGVRMSRGGIIVLDDYKWHMCPGVEKALAEFIERTHLKVYTLPDQAVILF